MTNVVKLPTAVHTYELIPINGEKRVARFNGEYWEVDKTAAIMTDRLRRGLISEELVQKYLDDQYSCRGGDDPF